MKLIDRALQFATKKHIKQLDDVNDPYIIHPVQVAEIIKLVSDDENLIAAAYLHDTIEDTKTTYKELVKKFNEDVANLVMEVTHDGSKDTLGYFFPRLTTKRGILLKFADRLSNLSRMESWDIARQIHYLKKSKFWKDQPVVRTKVYEKMKWECPIHKTKGILGEMCYICHYPAC